MMLLTLGVRSIEGINEGLSLSDFQLSFAVGESGEELRRVS